MGNSQKFKQRNASSGKNNGEKTVVHPMCTHDAIFGVVYLCKCGCVFLVRARAREREKERDGG